MTLLMILQLMIVLGALWVGSRYGSLALGAISGIGLTVARSLARRIGGDIMLDTAYIGGSRFVMTLPLTK